EFEHFHAERMKTPFGIGSNIMGIILLAISLSFLAFLAVHYFRYKPVASVSDEDLPTYTIIVPAYNEGKLVWQTLMSLAKSNYPAQKMQIIAIDDGSQDDTWHWIQQAKSDLGER